MNNLSSSVLESKRAAAPIAAPAGSVLIVDDEPFVLAATSRILQEANFVVYTCELWAKVSGFVRRTSPDLVLLDYHMPSLNGGEICSILKRNVAYPLQVILFSAEREEVLQEVCAGCGADGYLGKSLPPKVLVERLRGFLGQRGEVPEADPVGELRKVLLVDDSPVMRQMYREALRPFRCQVIEAADGREGESQLFANIDVDLILLDINMPVMSGIQFLHSVRKQAEFAHLPIVVCSTESEESDILDALKLGAKGYLKKPFAPSALRAVVNLVTQRKAGQAQGVNVHV